MLKACDAWAVLLSAYLDEETTRRERARVEEHLQSCDGCRALAELLRCDAQDAAAALRERGASDGFAAGVLARVAEEEIEPADRYAAIPLAPERPKRRTSIWEWLVVVSIVAVLSAILFPTFARSREKARQTTCTSQLRQIATAIQMYVQDEGAYPPADTWAAAIMDYAGSEKIFSDPVDTTPGSGGGINQNSYSYNTALAGQPAAAVHAPTETPVVWDSAPRHNGMIIGFADGHVRFFPRLNNINAYAELALAEQEAVAKRPASTALSSPPPPPGQAARPPAPPTIAPPTKNYGLADKLQIAYRAEVALESENVQAALERAELLFRRHDGFVLTSNYARGEEETPATAAVSGRVPSENLGKMLVELGALGTLVSRAVNGEDLTAAHLRNIETLGDLRGIQGRVGAIQDRAKPGDALRAEETISGASREATGARIEEYKLQSRVRLAEITVRITAPPVKKAEAKTVSPLAASLHGAVRGLRAFGLWLLAVLIPIAVFLPVWGPLLWLGCRLWRRYGTRPRPSSRE
ncbi:MAG TPA: DUF4349 domain-containing protein [Armatimonadota bacterium]|nr:DUF4349 domain-containing protein [Armatimonadota bacterium]HOS42075.1 DUF4349 domain-containing protein [Armatimonadota bacterium]